MGKQPKDYDPPSRRRPSVQIALAQLVARYGVMHQDPESEENFWTTTMVIGMIDRVTETMERQPEFDGYSLQDYGPGMYAVVASILADMELERLVVKHLRNLKSYGTSTSLFDYYPQPEKPAEEDS